LPPAAIQKCCSLKAADEVASTCQTSRTGEVGGGCSGRWGRHDQYGGLSCNRPDKTIGVLPLGTLNHFARDLKIPTDLELAAQTIVEGYAINVDVGEVNRRIFLNNSSLGLYPTIVREREKQQRLGAGKWPAFVWAAGGSVAKISLSRRSLERGRKRI